MSEKVKHITQIFSSKVITFLVSMVRGFFVPGYLGPKMYGVIHLLGLVKIVLGFSNMGFNQAYLRLLPNIRNSQNPDSEKVELQNTVFSFLFISSVVGLVITALIPFFIKQDNPEMQRLMVFCFSITAVSHFFTLVGSFFYQTQYIEKNFTLISKLNIVQSLLSFSLIMATVFYWKIYGVFLAELITVIVIQVVYFFQTKIHLNLQLNWEYFKKVFKFSFPFFLSNIGFYFARLIDRTVITVLLSFKDLGLYGFALNLSNKLRMVTISIKEVLTPYFLDELRDREDILNRSIIIKDNSQVLSMLQGYMVLNCIYFCSLIDLILPNYVDSILVLKILLINSYIANLTFYPKLILGTAIIRKQNYLNISFIMGGVCNVFISIYAIKLGYGIYGVAAGTVFSNIIITIFNWIFSHRLYLKNFEFVFYIRLMLPIILFFLTIFIDVREDVFIINKIIFFITLNILLGLIFYKQLKSTIIFLINRVIE